jgi:precorrin-6A/cobalt-precorrin-6A reductase
MPHHLLILGGTTEARELAAQLAGRDDMRVTLSLAGRTSTPASQDVATRSGGFGGAEGLAGYVRKERVTLLIDATHPFAARISVNAAEAAGLAQIPLIALRRPAWSKVEGDKWIETRTIIEAVASLGDAPKRVFVTFGRQELAPLEAHCHHSYLIRSIEPVRLALEDAQYILARGPFDMADEKRLLAEHRIEAVLAKNSGGTATYGKIAAARELGIPVHLVARPQLPDVPQAGTVEELLALIAHHTASLEKRGE